MTVLDNLAADWKKCGACVVSRHDFRKDGLTLSAVTPTKALKAAAEALLRAGYALLDVSVMEVREGFLATYHFDSFAEAGRTALRTLVPFEAPELPSLSGLFQGAEWHERECSDFFGVRFFGNPNPVPLLLPDDFDGPPPLRKDPAALAPLSALGLFGVPEILDPAWAELIGPGGRPKGDRA
ncbi:MAG: NADH-quinone oxidoreductase subunit C [Deltaproteobacteria bacterium]|jgi:NADH-quinone oxidoreductase subunit C|nr:NADH-quinone oxidoreductase subunit C [Deltaproteobacteria bacterium]